MDTFNLANANKDNYLESCLWQMWDSDDITIRNWTDINHAKNHGWCWDESSVEKCT